MNASERAALNEAMGRLADGERAALDPVYRLLWPRMLRFCERFLGVGPDAEDTAQQALLRLMDQAHTFDREKDALAWGLTMAAWECRSRQTTRRRAREHNLSAPEQVDPSDPERDTMYKQLNDALAHTLEGMSETDQQVLRRALAGEALGPKERKRKERALHRLRRLWKAVQGLDG